MSVRHGGVKNVKFEVAGRVYSGERSGGEGKDMIGSLFNERNSQEQAGASSQQLESNRSFLVLEHMLCGPKQGCGLQRLGCTDLFHVWHSGSAKQGRITISFWYACGAVY